MNDNFSSYDNETNGNDNSGLNSGTADIISFNPEETITNKIDILNIENYIHSEGSDSNVLSRFNLLEEAEVSANIKKVDFSVSSLPPCKETPSLSDLYESKQSATKVREQFCSTSGETLDYSCADERQSKVITVTSNSPEEKDVINITDIPTLISENI